MPRKCARRSPRPCVYALIRRGRRASAADKRSRIALDVTLVGHGHDHVLFDDHVLDVDLRGGIHDLRTALVAVRRAQVASAPAR